MLIKKVIINASPLITLFRAGLHPLLPQLFSEIYIPSSVWNEVIHGGHDDPARYGLPKVNWAKKISTSISSEVSVWNLGAGETAVLSHALYNREYWVIVDDRAARRCANILDVRLIGTAGVLVLAKRHGLIESLENSLRQLQHAGLWLSETMIQQLSGSEDT